MRVVVLGEVVLADPVCVVISNTTSSSGCTGTVAERKGVSQPAARDVAPDVDDGEARTAIDGLDLLGEMRTPPASRRDA